MSSKSSKTKLFFQKNDLVSIVSSMNRLKSSVVIVAQTAEISANAVQIDEHESKFSRYGLDIGVLRVRQLLLFLLIGLMSVPVFCFALTSLCTFATHRHRDDLPTRPALSEVEPYFVGSKAEGNLG